MLHRLMMGALLLAMLPMAFGQATAADEEKPWLNETDFSLVKTSGNTESTTIKLKNLYRYNWDRSELNFKVDGLRVDDTDVDRIVVVNPDGSTSVQETEDTETTAEKYNVDLNFHQQLSGRFKWYTEGKWTRDRFSGVENRFSLSAGVGHIWSDTDDYRFHTHYGVQYVNESLAFEPVGYDDSYMAATAGYQYRRKVGAHSRFEENLDLVMNLDDTDDFRATINTNFATNLTNRLALKIGLDAAYDHQPGFVEVFFADGSDSVAYQQEEWDLIFTTSLVLTF